MTATLRLKISSRNAQRMIHRALKGINDFRPALKKIQKMQSKEIEEAFKVSGKNITGTPWPRLKPSTIKQKLRSGYLTNVLVRTGKMRRSFRREELKPFSLKIGNTAMYFQFHQLGTKKMSRRQMLGHSQKMIKDAVKITSDYIVKKIKHG